MQLWTDPADVPADLPPTSVTIGTFDGVHAGHRALLDLVVADAARGLFPVAVTFDPHPMAVVRPDLAPALLTTVHHRADLLGDAGCEGVLVLQFTKERAAQTAEDFVRDILVETLHASHVIVGRNFRFGHRAAGDVALLQQMGDDLGFQVTPLDLVALEGQEPASSTAVRALIAAGDVGAACVVLGRPHRLTGTVVRGDQRGRDLGFPTANLDLDPALAVPADGVYAAWVRFSGETESWHPAAVSIGTNPTFDGQDRRVEAYVLDVPDTFDVYHQVADIDFVERLRGMHRFTDVAELVAQMHTDVEQARAALRVARSEG